MDGIKEKKLTIEPMFKESIHLGFAKAEQSANFDNRIFEVELYNNLIALLGEESLIKRFGKKWDIMKKNIESQTIPCLIIKNYMVGLSQREIDRNDLSGKRSREFLSAGISIELINQDLKSAIYTLLRETDIPEVPINPRLRKEAVNSIKNLRLTTEDQIKKEKDEDSKEFNFEE